MVTNKSPEKKRSSAAGFPTGGKGPAIIGQPGDGPRSAARSHARLRGLILLGLFGGLMLIAGLFVSFQRAVAEADHSREVVRLADQIMEALADAETGQRGTLLTGDDSYLAPYKVAVTRIDGLMAQIAALTADDAVQQENIQALRGLAREKLDEMELTLN